MLLRELPAGCWGFFIALAPVLPGLLVAWSVAREIGARDELQRRIQLEALAVAFPATAVIALGISLLEDNGVPRING